MTRPAGLAGSELAALARLDEAFNEFLQLDSHHPSELDDFRRAICAAKYIVKARAASPHTPAKENAADEPKPV